MTQQLPGKIELVVFDIAGTTVNDRTPAGDAVNMCLQSALRDAGVDVSSETVNDVMGIQKPVAIGMLLDGAGRSDLKPRVSAIHDDFVLRMKEFYEEDPSVKPVSGAADALAVLRRGGIKVALDTGFSRDITEIILQRVGWRDGAAIDASICSDEVAQGRPHPDMIHALMRRLGISDPKRVAKVGDTPADLHEGTNTGCGLVIGVTHGTHTREQLVTHPHTHLISSVADLPDLLRSLNLLHQIPV